MAEVSVELERASIDRDLSSVDEEMRRLAVERLLELPSASAIPRLIECLGDTGWRVRKAAVERIVACSESDEIVGALIEALADGENPGRRNSAVEALIACGSRILAPLVDALGSDDVDVRKLLIDVIAGIADPMAGTATIAMLEDPDTNVRAAAADALGVMPGADSGSALRGLVEKGEEDLLVRLSALHSLARLEVVVQVSELASALDEPVLCAAAFTLLGYSDDEESVAVLLKGLSLRARASREAGMEALLRVLAHHDGAEANALHERIREQAGHSELLISSAIDRLEEADLSDRLILIQFLGLLGDPRAVIPILEAGYDEAIAEVAHATLESLGEVAESSIDAHWDDLDSEGQRAACQLLGRTKGPSGTARLISALHGSETELRAAAALALGARGCIDALEELVGALEATAAGNDFEAEEEVLALEQALVDIAGGDPSDRSAVVSDVIERLAALLDDSEETLRLSVATVVSQICRPEDHEFIRLLQRDSSPQVRRVAVEGLERLAPETAVERLRLALADESPIVRISSAVALGRAAQPEVTADLRRLIADEDQRVRAAAVRAIGAQGARAGDDRAREACIELITPTLRDEGMVAMAAIESLTAVGGREAALAAASLLDRPEPELIQAAIACLGAHADGATLEDLFPLLSHDSWAVRADVVQTLAERRVGHAAPPILRRLELEQDDFVRDAILSALRRLEG